MKWFAGGWPLTRLGSVCQVSPTDPALGPDAPFVPMASVEVGSRYPRSFEPRGTRGGVRAKSGDVLFARITPCLENGKVAQVPLDMGAVGGSTEFIVVRPGPEVDPGYLYYWCLEPGVRALARGMMAGATGRMRLSGRDLAGFDFPLPPLPDQRRIVDALEGHISRLEAAEQSIAMARERALAWQRSHIDELFWGRSEAKLELGELLAEPMRNGHSARASVSGDGVRTLTLTAVTRGQFTDDFTKITTADTQRVADLWLRRGDILVQRANTPELVGTTQLYTGPDGWAIFPDLVIRCRVDPARVLPAYAAGAMRTERSHRWLRSRAKGLAGSMPKIDQATIAALRIPIPTLERQAATVARMAELDDAATRLTDACLLATARGSGLRSSLLHAAFTGRLTRAVMQSESLEPSDV